MSISVSYESVLDRLYKSFIVKVIKENRKVEQELGQKLYNFDKIYGTKEIELDMNRLLTIRWIKIPTFIERNRISYYMVYFVDIDWWRLGEMNSIYRMCMDCTEDGDVDSFTIFLAGKLEGYLHKKENKAIRKNMVIFNEYLNDIGVEHECRILKIMSTFLDKRCLKMSGDGKVFGIVERDLKRVSEFVGYIQNIERAKSLTSTELGIIARR